MLIMITAKDDHNPVMACLDVPVYRDKPYKRNVWRYDQADFWGMRGHLASTDWPSVFQEKTLYYM